MTNRLLLMCLLTILPCVAMAGEARKSSLETDVYKRQMVSGAIEHERRVSIRSDHAADLGDCLLYTSPSRENRARG